MIINKHGDTFLYNGVVYKIGDKVYSNGASYYRGLIGEICEIRNGVDKELEYEGPEFYCSFEPPISPYEIAELEQRFTALYQTQKTLENITLDMVIMKAEMLIPLKQLEGEKRKLELYIVHETWANNVDRGCSLYPFTEYEDAKAKMLQLISNEACNGGLIEQCSDKETFQTDASNDYYECWIDGSYNDSHYHVSIEQEPLHLSDKSFGTIAKAYYDRVPS